MYLCATGPKDDLTRQPNVWHEAVPAGRDSLWIFHIDSMYAEPKG